jgi:selenium metabolism protein YedF
VVRKEDGIFIYISRSGDENNIGKKSPAKGQEETCSLGEKSKDTHEKTTVLISSSQLGEGKGELGALLMRSLFFSVKEVGFLPDQIIFLNSGVYLTVEGSPILDELKEMGKKGVQLFSCGTCLDYYQLKDKLAVGQITNMYDVAEYLRDSTRCLTL